MKYSVRTIFLIFICLYAFFGAFNYAGAILSNPLSCFGPGTDFDATKAEANYYDPDPAPKINQFFCSIVNGGNKNGDTYFNMPGVNYSCKEGFNQSSPDNLKCTRCTFYDDSGCLTYDTADYYTCSYLGAGPHKNANYYQGYVYDNCTPSFVPPTVSITASPSSIISGDFSTLTWSSANADSCVASGGWSGAKAILGSQSVSPLVTTTYIITCSNSVGNDSDSATVTVLDSTPPTAPANLTATAQSSSQINLSWTASTDNIGVAGYRVYRDGTQVADTTTTSYSDTGLTPSTTYNYYVIAYDAAGNLSSQSNTASATTLSPPDTTPPAAITDLVASTPMTNSHNSMILSWTATGDDGMIGTALVYDLKYSTSPITSINWGSAISVAGEPAPAAPGTGQNMTVTGLNSLTTYYFAIMVQDDAGWWSPLSNVASRATTNLPDTVPPIFTFTSPLSLLPAGTASTNLSGTASELAVCRYSDVSGQNFDLMTPMSPSVPAMNFITLISGLTDGSTYTYFVKCRDMANNTSGDFPLSFSVDSLAPDLTPPVIYDGSPTGTLAANTTSVMMSARTNEPAYCKYNQNSDALYGSMTNTLTGDSAQTYHSVTLSGLANGASYLYYIRCQDTPGGNENTTGYPISFSVANPPNALPMAKFTANPLSGEAPLPVSVNSAGSYDTDGAIVSYVWQWGDSTPDATGATASHTYDTPGTYILKLTVTDNQNGSGSTNLTIIVSASPDDDDEVSTNGICAPLCTDNSECTDSDYPICAPYGICVANGAGGAGPIRDQGAFSLNGAEWLSGTPPENSPADFPAGTQLVVMRVHTASSTGEDLNAECQYSTEPNAPYGNTVYMKQFTSTGSTTSTVVLAVPKTSMADQADQTYNYYIRCKDSQTGVVNDTDYWLSFTIGGPTVISGPAAYVCWINQNFIKNNVPYLFDVCFSGETESGEVYSYSWANDSGWGPCNEPCGGGTQTRGVWCERNDSVAVADDFCSGPPPADTQTCNTQTCTAYNWMTGGWSACTESCGGGTQTRTVWCEDTNGVTVADGFCSGIKPGGSQTCNTQVCTTSFYGGNHTATDCIGAGGTVVNDGSYDFCRFNLSACPVDSPNWIQYDDWTTTTSNMCGNPVISSCLTGSHDWINFKIIPGGIEFCGYTDNDNLIDIVYCYANVTQIGCY
ncbi:MAG TPA: thrombospondin type-1 domain-containing protein [Candidatus Paceibacterota bacterium]